ncbi:MAG TPA: hypothetical protein VF044_05105, partial [Actinomycetota bacterium]
MRAATNRDEVGLCRIRESLLARSAFVGAGVASLVSFSITPLVLQFRLPRVELAAGDRLPALAVPALAFPALQMPAVERQPFRALRPPLMPEPVAEPSSEKATKPAARSAPARKSVRVPVVTDRVVRVAPDAPKAPAAPAKDTARAAEPEVVESTIGAPVSLEETGEAAAPSLEPAEMGTAIATEPAVSGNEEELQAPTEWTEEELSEGEAAETAAAETVVDDEVQPASALAGKGLDHASGLTFLSDTPPPPSPPPAETEIA